MKKLLLLIALSPLALADTTPPAAKAPLTVADPWIRLAPPTAAVLAGYADLRNDSDQDLIIQSLSSPQFDKVELHEMSMTGGVMKMRRADPYTLKAKASLTLKPGGWHLMLIGPKQPMPVGAQATLFIHTNAGDLSLDIQVYPPKS